MKILKRKSWHGHLAFVYGTADKNYPPQTICEYAWYVLGGLLRATFFVTGPTIVMGLLIHPFGNAILLDIVQWTNLSLIEYAFWSNVFGLIFVVSLLVSSLLGLTGLYGIFQLFFVVIPRHLTKNKKDKKESGFIAETYKAWHDKVCTFVKFD
jgi:quinol-cytochrome oxidoreductase complex cytochrome b subunit